MPWKWACCVLRTDRGSGLGKEMVGGGEVKEVSRKGLAGRGRSLHVSPRNSQETGKPVGVSKGGVT